MTVVNAVLVGLAFILGCASGLGAGLFLGVISRPGQPGARGTEASAPAESQDSESLRLARQYENIMNYDGTERGQMSLEL